MKEANVLSQLALVESINKCRQSQIDTITNAVDAFKQEPNIPQSRIYSYVALYLSYLAQWLEKEIASEMMYLSELKNLPTYASEIQIDFRIASSFGVLDGISHLGNISSELIGQSQRALHKAGLLALTANKQRDLKAFDDSKGDDLYIAALEASKPNIINMHLLVRTCTGLAANFKKMCDNAAQEADVSVASASSTSCGTTISSVLSHLAKVIGEPFSPNGIFDNDPAHMAGDENVQIARAMAAGITADVVATFIRKRIRWTAVTFN